MFDFLRVDMPHYIYLAALLMGISLVGIVINRKNIITVLMCLELMLLAVNFNFLAFSHAFKEVQGQVFVFFILTVAAAEAAIGLAIMILLWRSRNSIAIQDIASLKG